MHNRRPNAKSIAAREMSKHKAKRHDPKYSWSFDHCGFAASRNPCRHFQSPASFLPSSLLVDGMFALGTHHRRLDLQSIGFDVVVWFGCDVHFL